MTGEKQALVGVPVTVYNVLVRGAAVTLGPVEGVKPVVGDHVHVKLERAEPATPIGTPTPGHVSTVSIVGLQTEADAPDPGYVT